MSTEHSLLSFVTDAGLVVQFVMLLLLAASIVSWTIIFQRGIFLRDARVAIKDFEGSFWSGIDVNKLYQQLHKKSDDLHGLESVFYAGFDEFTKLSKHPDSGVILAGVERAMNIAVAREIDKLDQHLPFLATIGSVSPYVGLFGTVWGIMTSFQALGNIQQATIAMVAPGISEALIATAMGLFSAIPAVIAYNRYTSNVERLSNSYVTFQEEFFNILHRQTHIRSKHAE